VTLVFKVTEPEWPLFSRSRNLSDPCFQGHRTLVFKVTEPEWPLFSRSRNLSDPCFQGHRTWVTLVFKVTEPECSRSQNLSDPCFQVHRSAATHIAGAVDEQFGHLNVVVERGEMQCGVAVILLLIYHPLTWDLGQQDTHRTETHIVKAYISKKNE